MEDKQALSDEDPRLVPILTSEEQNMYDPVHERVFLALLIANPSWIQDASIAVQPSWMMSAPFKFIYEVMLSIFHTAIEKGWSPTFDVHTMTAAMIVLRPNLSESDATADLRFYYPLVNASKEVGNVQWHPALYGIKSVAAKVRLYREARLIQRRLQDKSVGFEQMTTEAEQRIMQAGLLEGQGYEARYKHISTIDDVFMKKCNYAHHHPDRMIFNVPCAKYSHLMSLLNGGFRRKHLCLIMARTKVGKSQFLQSIATHCSVVQQIPVLYLDTEMDQDEVYPRMLSAESTVREFDITKGSFLADGEEESAAWVNHARAQMKYSRLYYAKVAGRPMEYVISLMRQFHRDVIGSEMLSIEGQDDFPCTNPGMVIFDWIRMTDIGAVGRGVAEHQLLGQICQDLKRAAEAIDLPVIAAMQASRAAIGAKGHDVAELGEGFVSGSDKPAQFCNLLCYLRNINRVEEDRIKTWEWEHPVQRVHIPGDDYRNMYYFNQVLHVLVQRGGPDCKDGIPLYLRRGYSQYEEMVLNEEGEDRGTLEFLREAASAKKKSGVIKQQDIIGGVPPEIKPA